MIEFPNYTQFPNILLDRLPEFSNAEFKLVAFICRETVGCDRQTVEIPMKRMREETGLSLQGIRNSVNSLVEMGFIIEIKGKPHNIYELKSLSTPQKLINPASHSSSRSHARKEVES